MSPGGTDASLTALVVGFFVAASIIAVITMILRRRSDSQDLTGTQVREMQARAAAAARDTATRDHGDHDTTAGDTEPPAAEPEHQPVGDTTATPAGSSDAMADAYTWLRIVGLVESGQRAQAVELISTTMAIPAEEAEMLVDGLTDPAGKRPH